MFFDSSNNESDLIFFCIDIMPTAKHFIHTRVDSISDKSERISTDCVAMDSAVVMK